MLTDIINSVLWHSPKNNFTQWTWRQCNVCSEITLWKLLPHISGANELKGKSGCFNRTILCCILDICITYAPPMYYYCTVLVAEFLNCQFVMVHQTPHTSRTKSINLIISCLVLQLSLPNPLKRMLSREWRCSWSSANRRCSRCIWVIKKFFAYLGRVCLILEVWWYIFVMNDQYCCLVTYVYLIVTDASLRTWNVTRHVP